MPTARTQCLWDVAADGLSLCPSDATYDGMQSLRRKMRCLAVRLSPCGSKKASGLVLRMWPVNNQDFIQTLDDIKDRVRQFSVDHQTRRLPEDDLPEASDSVGESGPVSAGMASSSLNCPWHVDSDGRLLLTEVARSGIISTLKRMALIADRLFDGGHDVPCGIGHAPVDSRDFTQSVVNITRHVRQFSANVIRKDLQEAQNKRASRSNVSRETGPATHGRGRDDSDRLTYAEPDTLHEELLLQKEDLVNANRELQRKNEWLERMLTDVGTQCEVQAERIFELEGELGFESQENEYYRQEAISDECRMQTLEERHERAVKDLKAQRQKVVDLTTRLMEVSTGFLQAVSGYADDSLSENPENPSTDGS